MILSKRIKPVKLWLGKATDHQFHYDDFVLSGCCSYLISQDNQSLYWKKLDDVDRELFRITEDFINKLSVFNLSQVRRKKPRFIIFTVILYRCVIFYVQLVCQILS